MSFPEKAGVCFEEPEKKKKKGGFVSGFNAKMQNQGGWMGEENRRYRGPLVGLCRHQERPLLNRAVTEAGMESL